MGLAADFLMRMAKRSGRSGFPVAVAVGFILLAGALRLWPLAGLGGRVAWLTFYPAVMAAALVGGFWAGLLGAALACLVVAFPLSRWVGTPFLRDGFDLVGMGVFFVTCTLVSLLAESMRRALLRAREAEQDRDRLFDLSLDMLCISSADGYFKRMSPAFTEVLGWSLEELTGHPYTHFLHPDDVAATLAAVERQIARGERVFQFENRYRHRDGSYRWLSWQSVPQSGGLMYGSARDITRLRAAETALRRSEENLEVTLESIGDAVLGTDLDGCITRMNSVAERLMGWSRKEALGRPVHEVFRILHETTRQPSEIPVARVLATGLVQGLANHTVLIHRDGRETPIADSAAPIRTPDGEMRGVIFVFRDVTEEKRAEEALRESEQRLRSLNEELEARVKARTEEVRRHEILAYRSQRMESLGTLAGGVAHDLNNALAPILMGVDILRTKYPGDESIVDLFEASAQRGSALVRQLLTFAKGSEGALGPVDTERLLANLFNMLQGTFPKNIRLEEAWARPLPVLRGNLTQVEQVLLNLCVNARDAMPEGGTLTLEAGLRVLTAPMAGTVPDSLPGAYAFVSVRDSGAGMAPEVLERIFEPFFSTKASDKGTGLGLPTAVGILKAHDGFLQVQSIPGQGSTFTVFFPLDPSATQALPLPAGDSLLRGLNRTVLLVDDEGPIREVAAEVLSRMGFRVLSAGDGEEGLALAERCRGELSVIIADLHMPRLDGLALARGLRERAPEVPVVVSSGCLESEAREAFVALGLTVFLDKPYTHRQLTAVLEEVLGAEPVLSLSGKSA